MKRFLSLVLCLSMLLTLMPQVTYAEDGTTTEVYGIYKADGIVYECDKNGNATEVEISKPIDKVTYLFVADEVTTMTRIFGAEDSNGVGSKKLKTVNFSSASKLNTIDDYAFQNCRELTNVDLSGATSLSTIGIRAFYGCNLLGTVDLSGATSLSTIGEGAFSSCGLGTVDLSGATSLSTIGNNAFSFCGSLGTVDLSGARSLSTIEKDAFYGCHNLTTIAIPYSKYEEYKVKFNNTGLSNIDNVLKVYAVPTITGTTTKEYDGTTNCNGDGLDIIKLQTKDNEDISEEITYEYTYNDENVEDNKDINIKITNPTYLLLTTSIANGVGEITAKPITAKEITGTTTKEYDGTTACDGKGLTIVLEGIVGSDDVAATATYTYDNANVGNEKTITASDITLTGIKGINYQLETKPTTLTAKVGTIANKVLTPYIKGSATKVYDGTTDYNGTDLSIGLRDEKGNEVTGLTAIATYTYDNANVGTGKTITASVILEGTSAGNYHLSSNSVTAGVGEITAKPITAKEITGTATKVYDGTTACDGKGLTVVLEGIVGSDEVAATATYTYDDANVGTGKTITASEIKLTGTKAGNYKWETVPTTLSAKVGEITKADYENKTVSTSAKYGKTAEYDIASLLSQEATVGTINSSDVTDGDGILDGTPIVSGTKIKYTLKDLADKVGKTATVNISVTAKNYKDYTVTLAITVSDKEVPVLTLENIEKTYNGQAVSNSEIKGTATVDGKVIQGTWKFSDGQDITNVKDSGAKEVVFTPNDIANYAEAKGELVLTISKATPVGTPSYTSVTEEGKTLADGNLSIGSIVPAEGIIKWDLEDTTVVEQDVEYAWTFTPTDSDNYNNLTGSVKLYISTGGGGGGTTPPPGPGTGGGGGGTTPTPEPTPEPTPITTPVVETTVDEVGNVVAEVKVPEATVIEKVEVLAELGSTSGTVFVEIKYEDGTTKKTMAVYEDNKVFVKLEDNATVNVLNEVTEFATVPAFTDTTSHWAKQYIETTAKLGLFNGKSATNFGAEDNMTREQMWMVLSRLQGEGQGTMEDAKNWAMANGISDGSNPQGNVTREQLVTLLWRASGSPKSSYSLSAFGDSNKVSSWAQDAFAWAVEIGLVNGTTADTLSPRGTATRGQLAAIFARLIY